MARATLTLLCLWSYIVIVTPLTDTQVHRAMDYITRTFSLPDTKQHAFIAVLSKAECDSLSSNNNNLQILRNEERNKISNALNDDKQVYEGSQMVLATYKRGAQKGEHDIHSEYRLLFPSAGSTDSPVQRMLNKNNNAACALFYSLNSPCVGVCANVGHSANVINKLSVFDRFNKNNKAFVYRILYVGDLTSKKTTKENIWAGLTQIDSKMDVYRCFSSKCLHCFVIEKNKQKNKGHCLN